MRWSSENILIWVLMNHKIPAFTLIELTIVLIILGMIGQVTLPLLRVLLDRQKATLTAERQEKILYAFATYALHNRSLPYAADPLNHQGKQDFITRRRRGIVPYHDLGLPESVVKDGYHHWFTYVVDGYYVEPSNQSVYSPSSSHKLCAKYLSSGGLKIKGLQENVALVLISHGPQGKGAYATISDYGSFSEDEKQNTVSEHELVDRPLSQDSSNLFSHKIVWVTAKNLMAIYGCFPCPSSADISKPPQNIFQPPESPSQTK